MPTKGECALKSTLVRSHAKLTPRSAHYRCADMFTRDQVPVQLRVYLRWQLMDPLKLCAHGYKTPYDALKDKALSVLTQIVAHRAFLPHVLSDCTCANLMISFAVEYASMIKQRTFSPGDDASDGPDDKSSAFLDALRTRAMDELHESARECK